jgi:hypothetical protein
MGKRIRTAGTKQVLTCFPLHQPHIRRLRAFKGLHHFSNLHRVYTFIVKALATYYKEKRKD